MSSFCVLKTIVLPRQARDKHSESPHKKMTTVFFSQAEIGLKKTRSPHPRPPETLAVKEKVLISATFTKTRLGQHSLNTSLNYWSLPQGGEEAGDAAGFTCCLDSPFVQQELRWAMQYGKQIIVVRKMPSFEPCLHLFLVNDHFTKMGSGQNNTQEKLRTQKRLLFCRWSRRRSAAR